jgi:hypothetical protein
MTWSFPFTHFRTFKNPSTTKRSGWYARACLCGDEPWLADWQQELGGCFGEVLWGSLIRGSQSNFDLATEPDTREVGSADTTKIEWPWAPETQMRLWRRWASLKVTPKLGIFAAGRRNYELWIWRVKIMIITWEQISDKYSVWWSNNIEILNIVTRIEWL